MCESVGQREAVGAGTVDGLGLVARRPTQRQFRAVQVLAGDDGRQQVRPDGDLLKPARALRQDNTPQLPRPALLSWGLW